MRKGWLSDYERMRPLDGLPPIGRDAIDCVLPCAEERRRRINEDIDARAQQIKNEAKQRVEESRRRRDAACLARVLAK